MIKIYQPPTKNRYGRGFGVWGQVVEGKPLRSCPYLGVWGSTGMVSVLFTAPNGMPVTRNRQALNLIEEIVSSWSPGMARLIRRFFDRLEDIAASSTDLFRLGTPLFEGFLGPLAKVILRLMGKEALIDRQYR